MDMLNKIYLDIDTEIVGMLSLDIDKEKREWHENYFYQSEMFCNTELWRKLCDDIIKPCKPNLVVTFNGRAYDFGDRLATFFEQVHIIMDDVLISDLLNRDRDLIDICKKRCINIKSDKKEKIMGDIWESGLWSTVDRSIGYFESKENGGADRKLEEKYRRARQNYHIAFSEAPTLWSYDINRKYTDRNRYKWKNEADVRALPLLEEALGLLYELRIDEDNYRHRW